MDAFITLAQQQPLIFIHVACALGATLLGVLMLLRRKGTGSHRALGWVWVLLMGGTAASSVFISASPLPHLAGFSPIHLLSAYVAWQLPMAVRDARRGDIDSHRRRMRGMFFGGCVVAGLFTLLPGRFLGALLWHDWLGLVG